MATLDEHCTARDRPHTPCAAMRAICAVVNNDCDLLSVTEYTVKGHVEHILAKLRANDRTHAVPSGLKRGTMELLIAPR